MKTRIIIIILGFFISCLSIASANKGSAVSDELTFSTKPLPLLDYPTECSGWPASVDEFYKSLLVYDMSYVNDIRRLSIFWSHRSKEVKTYLNKKLKPSKNFLDPYAQVKEPLESFFEITDESIYNFYFSPEWFDAFQDTCGEAEETEEKMEAKGKLVELGGDSGLFGILQKPGQGFFAEQYEAFSKWEDHWSAYKDCGAKNTPCPTVLKEVLNQYEKEEARVTQYSYCHIHSSFIVSSCSCRWLTEFGLTSSSCDSLKKIEKKWKINLTCGESESSKSKTVHGGSQIVRAWCDWSKNFKIQSEFCNSLNSKKENFSQISCF